ncbi:hypothetical protein PPTG_09653 [Phytophthora nicotianae INRA-310]|uniref:Uncharacterized protein n=1 Tax=Phytophthora nicotianae (strain INRA-310) TaxID=761204 RepID=W2QIA4_PHYN3|nr:hypothetical protein PPTG_09653 [Phytophthora nicotianae INRA-310]ETN12000.1 hypothetical protein PPTG_09653 [Phytophthora nicotianae INRA-310]
MDVVIKDTLDGNNGDNNDDIQVTDSSTMDKSRVSELGSVKTSVPEEPSEEPKLDENVHAALKQIATAPLSSEDQSNTESAPDPTSKNEESHTELPISSTSADLVEADEVTKAKNEQLPVGKSLQAPVDANNDDVEVKKFVPTDQSEAVEVESNGQPCIQEAQLRDEDSSVANTGDEDVDEVDLTPDQSTESFPTKPSGFLESLTADFAPDTKVMWAQIFGPRYEDDDEAAYFQEDNQSNAGSSRESVSSKSSLQAKLARERKLDEQIQASQRRYRERVLRQEAANNTATRRGRVRSSRRSQAQIPTVSPFEQAGLSLTQIRFCTEKALDETIKCFRHLHAAALEETEDPDQPLTQGIYITQAELDHLLRELFDPQELERSKTRTRKGTIVAPLDFTQNGGVSMNVLLQASWFIPFGQLQQLRSLVMKITKRHLNEEKLAIVNRHLQKQFTLLPLSAKLQNLVLQLSNYQLKDPLQASVWPEGNKSSEELAQDLLRCIAVNEDVAMTGSEDYKNSVLFMPVEHVVNMKLPSVVCAQRLVFYRYLIDIVAAERIRVHSKTAELQEPPVQSPARRKSTTGRRKSSTKRKLVQHAPESEATTRSCEQPVDNEETATIRSEHESLPSASEADGVSDTPAEEDIFELPEQVGDECEKPASQLQQQLESAIAQLRQTLPNIDSDADLNPAIRATYLAAAACHESVLLMLDNNIDVDAAMSNKLRHFIEALESIQATEQIVTTAPVEVEGLDHQLRDPPRFPPPYPESTVSEEEDSKSETSTLQQQFPPPYAITSPSYWTFTPSIPEPKSSISKLASKSATNKSVDLRSQFLSKESPGVGAYNVEKGENLTFQRKPSYSFGPTEGDRDRKAPNALLSNGSTGKRSSRSTLRQRMKTSFEFVPRTDHSAENNGIDFNTSTRVHVDSKFEDSHIGTNGDLFNDLPPDYNEGDANEASEEKAGGSDETEMDRALRLQQRIFMDEFVHQVMSNQDSHTRFVPRGKQNTTNANLSKSQPYWATSEVSPGIERLLNRQRRAPTANKFRPSSASTAPIRTTNRVAKKAPPPLRRQLDNDQHLAWAARISELYQPAVPAPDQ